LHDPLGLRQVFYSDTHGQGSFWCASQPGLIARRADLRPDPDVLDFVRSGRWPNDEHWLPGDISPLRGVKHLLPNHFLDLSTGQTARYWPRPYSAHVSFKDAVGSIMETLSGLMLAANARFDLAISLTAGLDSRLVLAASRPIISDVVCMTVRTRDTPSADYEIPAGLARQLGFRHEIVDAFDVPDDSFRRVFNGNVPLPHQNWAPIAWAILRHYQHLRVGATGSGAEIAQCRYGVSRGVHKPTVDQLCAHTRMPDRALARDSFSRWLTDLPDHTAQPLDLFYWEHRTGSWLASAQLEIGDVAWRDVFTPYNCRTLLEHMLSIDARHRRPPVHRLQRHIIGELWPETLRLPTNPHWPDPTALRRFVSLPGRAARRLRREISAMRGRSPEP
jgi:hypothetical protein